MLLPPSGSTAWYTSTHIGEEKHDIYTLDQWLYYTLKQTFLPNAFP